MPEWKQYVRSRMRGLRVKPEREAEIVEELAAQLEQTYQEALQSGKDKPTAEAIATAQLPDWEKLAGEIESAQAPRHHADSRFWQGIPGDLRHALRMLQKSPVFTVVAIATLALGIGGCTAIFSLIEAVVLRPIGYRDPEQLVMVWEHQYRRGFHKNVVAMADYLDWKARNHVFSDMSPILDQSWNLGGVREPVVLTGMSVNEHFLSMLGVQPLLGRSFSAEETRVGAPGVVLLSHRIWTERFGASRDAIGQTILLDDTRRTIIGVLPADFPWLGKPLDAMTPAQFRDRNWRQGAGRFLRVAARLKPGVSVAAADKEMNGIARQLEAEYPEFNKDWGVEIVPMSEHFAGEAGTGLWILMGAVGLVLLIACSNVANLMLARAVVREREIALRAALGATTSRLVRLLMIESIVLALVGGFLGAGGAYVAIRLIQTYGPRDVARLDTAGLHLPVAIFAILASCATGIIFGLAPAFAAGHLNLAATLKDGGRGVMNTVRGERVRSVFVVAQICLAFVLLTGASLLLQSLYRLSNVPTGFDSHNVLTGTILVSGNIDNAKLGVMCGQMLDRVREIPGVDSAGFITFLPFTGMGAGTGYFLVGGPVYAPGQTPITDVRVVQPGYFETMRIPLRQGRIFQQSDNRAEVPRGFVVNETLVRQMFGTSNPLGRSLNVQMGDGKPGEIIGVVGDTKHKSLDGEIRPMVYYVQAHLPISFGTFVVRTKGKPEMMASAMTAAIQSVKRDQPVNDIKTMDERIARSYASMRFQTALLASFAGIAILLAVIGIYGVIAYSVEQRTHEIQLRLVLGADPGKLQRWITARGMRLAAVGLACGMIAAFASSQVLRSLLYDVKPHDPGTFAMAFGVLALACLVASYIPAFRAVRVDPAGALRI